MEKIVDFLAEELEREEAKQTRRAQKRERMRTLLRNLTMPTEPLPVMDFLGD